MTNEMTVDTASNKHEFLPAGNPSHPNVPGSTSARCSMMAPTKYSMTAKGIYRHLGSVRGVVFFYNADVTWRDVTWRDVTWRQCRCSLAQVFLSCLFFFFAMNLKHAGRLQDPRWQGQHLNIHPPQGKNTTLNRRAKHTLSPQHE